MPTLAVCDRDQPLMMVQNLLDEQINQDLALLIGSFVNPIHSAD